jgi:AcrR family transcriptional regulator
VPRAQPVSERRTATRQRLIDAALEVVARNGFHAASVDEIAERAGFSIGALYGNFAGKDELFFAVFDAHLDWFEERLAEAAAADDPARGIADLLGAFGRRREQFLVFIEFWAYAVRDPKLRRQFARRMGEVRERMRVALVERADAAGTELPLPAEQLSLLLSALGRGLLLEKLADPAAVSDDDIGDLLARLVP